MTSQTRIARSVYFLATVCVLALSVPVHAQLTSFPIDFSEHHNAGMVTNAPVGNVRLGGVLFEIPTSGPNYWDGFVAGGGPGERVIEWPVGQMGVREIHTLINTDWGTAGGPFAKIEFFGSEGAYYLKNLFSCEDIRDHSPNNGNCDTINGTTSINVWNNGLSGRARFIVDKQQINLPADFWDEVLVSVTITDAGHGEGHQRLMVMGLTVIAPLFGDPNCDGEINALDIEPFLLAMFDPDEYAIHYPNCDLMLADVNCDDVVNASDIEPFIDLLFP